MGHRCVLAIVLTCASIAFVACSSSERSEQADVRFAQHDAAEHNVSSYGMYRPEGSGVRAPVRRQPAATPASTTRTTTRTEPAPEPRTTTTGSRPMWPSQTTSQAYIWTAMAYPTGDANTSAVGLERGVPREVRINQPFESTLVVTNLTAHELENVVVYDSPGEGFNVASTSPEARTDRSGMVWTVGTLGPYESRVIKINGTATREGTIAACSSVSYDTLLCSEIAVVSPKLKLDLAGPAEALGCEEIVYRFKATNEGTGALSNVRIQQALPRGLTTDDGSSTVSLNVGTLEPGQSRELNATLSAAESGRFTSRAVATAAGDLRVESGEVVTTVRNPELEVTVDAPESEFAGRNATYEITVTNVGDGEARDTVIENVVPRTARFVSAASGGQFAAGKVRWNLGTLRPGDSKTVTVDLTSETMGTLSNAVTATAHCADTATATARTAFSGIPAILLEVVDANDPVAIGEDTTYVITATNQGSADDRDISIACFLEDEMRFVSASGDTRGTNDGNEVTFEPLARLAPGAKATWRVVVKAVSAGDVRFKVTMNTDELTRNVEETEATNFYE